MSVDTEPAPSAPSSPFELEPISPEAPLYSALTSLEASSPESSQEGSSQSEFSSAKSTRPSSSESRRSVGDLVYSTYKLVGDKLDKHVKLREMRVDAQPQSLHYNVLAVRDRVDASSLLDRPALPDMTSVRVEDILPTDEGHKAITTNSAILTARVLAKYLPYFSRFGSGLEKHIKHRFCTEMSQKSEVVSVILC